MKKFICVLLCFVVLLCSACSDETVISMSFAVKETAGSFDPQIAGGATTNILVKNCFEGLVRYDENGDIVPGVAEKWEISDDGLTYTFTLRENAVWHITNTAKTQLEEKLPEDFSLSVTAHDFVFALQRAVDPATNADNAELLRNISNASAIIEGNANVSSLGVKALDDYILEITLAGPQSNFLNVLTESICMPCNKTFFNACGGRYGMFIKYFLSNGPFYVSYFDEKSYRLSKSTDYTGSNFAVADTLWFYVTSEENVIGILQEHQYSGASLSETQFSQLKVDKKMTVLETQDVSRCFIINTQSEKLSDINIRLAFASAVDAKSLAENNSKTPASLVPEAVSDMPDSSFSLYNPEKAKEYLSAGLKNMGERSVSLTLLTQTEYEAALKIALQNWQQALGVNMFISIEAVSEAELLSRVAKGEYEIAFYPVKAKTPSAEDFFAMFSSSSDNIINLEDEGYDKLVNSLYSASDSTFAKEYAATEQKLLSTAAIIPVWQENTVFVCTEDARGIITLAGDDNLYLYNATDAD